MEQLLNAIFTCWEDKKISYLQNIIQEFNNNESTVNNNNNNEDDGDANWATKPSNPPPNLENLPTENEKEQNILNVLLANLNQLSWFNNTSEQWVNAPGNNGRSDISCVLVGNMINAPIRRNNLYLGFMYVGPNNMYPLHAHAATEAYHIVAGEAWLRKNDSGFLHKFSGNVNIHDPYDKHALVTKDNPVLIVWVNSGDVNGEYYFVDEKKKGNGSNARL